MDCERVDEEAARRLIEAIAHRIDPHTHVPDAQGRPLPIAGDGAMRPELLERF